MLSDNWRIQMKLKDTGWTQQARIWVAGVQTTGSRKSAQMHAPMAPIYALEEKWRAIYSDELEVWNTLSEDEQKEKRKPRLRVQMNYWSDVAQSGNLPGHRGYGAPIRIE